jgi:hypothetical protein
MNKFSKCYNLNPDRGTRYGWISNNAQDSWWWREVACGGESEDSNGGPVNSFLPKKGVLEKDSEYAKEDASYEVWKIIKFFCPIDMFYNPICSVIHN